MSSFGGEAIDNYGVVRDFPARSMLTGLIGNALGLERHDADALDALQARLLHASGLARPGHRSRDYQTARLFENEAGWTTRGAPEGRAKSPSFAWDELYERERGVRRKSLTHQRYRDYDADAVTMVALALDDAPTGPDLDTVRRALERPVRPLFIGRKACLPSRPILRGRTEAPDPVRALASAIDDGYLEADAPIRVQWAMSRGSDDITLPKRPGQRVVLDDSGTELLATRRTCVSDERRHASGVHGGEREVMEGEILNRLPKLPEARPDAPEPVE